MAAFLLVAGSSRYGLGWNVMRGIDFLPRNEVTGWL
jgi:hypothetical protein